jgi:hypothetical protein
MWRKMHSSLTGLTELLGRHAEITATGSQRTHIDAGEAALERIEKAARQSFADWMTVGRALSELQALALNVSGANEPVGKAYNAAYAGLIERLPRLSALDKGTASRARWMHTNRDAVEEWHGNITNQNLRNEINHPRVVKERFEKFLRAQEGGDDGEAKEPKPKKPSVADLLNKEMEGLRAYIIELEQANEALRVENEALTGKLEAAQADFETRFRQRLSEAAKRNPYDKPSSRKASLPLAEKPQRVPGNGKAGWPRKHKGGQPLKYPWDELDAVGKSVEVDLDQQHAWTLSNKYVQRHWGGKCSARALPGDRAEVTRVS